jgi:hypothetical protein
MAIATAPQLRQARSGCFHTEVLFCLHLVQGLTGLASPSVNASRIVPTGAPSCGTPSPDTVLLCSVLANSDMFDMPALCTFLTGAVAGAVDMMLPWSRLFCKP